MACLTAASCQISWGLEEQGWKILQSIQKKYFMFSKRHFGSLRAGISKWGQNRHLRAVARTLHDGCPKCGLAPNVYTHQGVSAGPRCRRLQTYTCHLHADVQGGFQNSLYSYKVFVRVQRTVEWIPPGQSWVLLLFLAQQHCRPHPLGKWFLNRGEFQKQFMIYSSTVMIEVKKRSCRAGTSPWLQS